MNFIEAMDAVCKGYFVRRKNWLSPAGQNSGVDNFYVKMDEAGQVCVYQDDDGIKKDLSLTKANLESNDWEFFDTYQIELAALKRKHGRD